MGYRNTAYFHKSTSAHRKRNNICGLRDANNSLHTDQLGMENVVTNFYSDLFASKNPAPGIIGKISNLISSSITPDLNDAISADFTRDEVRQALFDLIPAKAPGPDGLTALFF